MRMLRPGRGRGAAGPPLHVEDGGAAGPPLHIEDRGLLCGVEGDGVASGPWIGDAAWWNRGRWGWRRHVGVETIPSDSLGIVWNPTCATNSGHRNWIKFQVSIP
jgi:hypothetical protein